MNNFSSIAVLGAGVMGSGIAAQIANAGQRVLLLDLPTQQAGDKSPSQKAIEKLLVSDPPQLMTKARADLITGGTIADDFDRLADCDLIIEAVIEKLPIKHALYKKLAEVRRADCIITSNTSTIPISVLTQNMDKAFCEHFAITHYFNPVRYMRLLELVGGAHTKPHVIEKLSDFNDRLLGKGVVHCADTPGFLGNRVGVYALQVALHEALTMRLAIEVADGVMARPMGIPKTGLFGLYDLIGIDLMSDVVASLVSLLPPADDFHNVGHNPDLVKEMIATGYIGHKGKGGFYRAGTHGREVRMLEIEGRGQDWRAHTRTLPDTITQAIDALNRQEEPLDILLKADDLAGQFAQKILARILNYAAGLVPEIASSPQDIDDAMKLGFNWQRGPFEMIDAIGIDRFKALCTQQDIAIADSLKHRTTPYYQVCDGILHIDRMDGLHPISLPAGVMRFSMMRKCLTPVTRNRAASLYHLEGDIRLVEFHSKANALTDLSMAIIAAAADDAGAGIIIHNDAQHFSAGVDLNHFLSLIEREDFAGIDSFLQQFQRAVRALKYASVPVIGTASGLALGGGCEVLLHCDRLIMHANSTLGLVESGVGLVPSGGGVMTSYLRWYEATGDWDKAAWQAWMQIGYGKIGTSPELSARYHYFKDGPFKDGSFKDGHDLSVMNRDRLLPTALEVLRSCQKEYSPPKPPTVKLASPDLLARMENFMQEGVARGDFTPHNKTVALAIGRIIVADTGESQESSEQALYDRERRAFIHLARMAETKSLIAQMLGKV